MRLLFRSFELVFLFGAFLVEAAVLYFVDEPMTRAVVGVLLILPIVWIVARTNTVGMTSDIPDIRDSAKKRHFKGLRSRVAQLLDEIRRLNGMAVDAERGFRDRDQAMREMDRIESHLKEIISEIRNAAGQSAAEPEPGVEGLGPEAEESEGDSTIPAEAATLPADEGSNP